MTSRNGNWNDVAYVQAAVEGEQGPRAQDAATTAINTAAEHGYADDAPGIAEHVRSQP